jgi:hypothetical protein
LKQTFQTPSKQIDYSKEQESKRNKVKISGEAKAIFPSIMEKSKS